ncbi:MAG: hypothetical protein ACYS6W_11620 [Planctomycetota bacterium]|jgi:hypothetical protein
MAFKIISAEKVHAINFGAKQPRAMLRMTKKVLFSWEWWILVGKWLETWVAEYLGEKDVDKVFGIL